MSAGKKRFLVPLGTLVILALAVFLLGRFGVIALPWSPGAEAHASEDSDGDKKKGKGEGEEEIIPVPVELAQVEPRRISAYYRASSSIEADRLVEIVAKTTGRVRKVNVEEGDWVHRGDILAELENERERLELRQTDLRLEDQKRELARRESLLEQKLVTQEEFDATRSAYDLAEVDKGLANIRVEDTIIRAPFDGQVTDRYIVTGQHLNVSERLFTIVDFEPLRVRIHLPEAVARKIRPGDRVQIVTEALDSPVEAVVERISPIVAPTTSTVRLTLLVEERAEELRVGGFVKVRITTDTHHEALSVPKIALVEEGGLRSVFMASADSVRKVEVRTGLYDESHVEILDGLEEGHLVVSMGQGGLRTGSRIDVLNADAVGWTPPDPPEDDEGKDEGGESDDDADDDE